MPSNVCVTQACRGAASTVLGSSRSPTPTQVLEWGAAWLEQDDELSRRAAPDVALAVALARQRIVLSRKQGYMDSHKALQEIESTLNLLKSHRIMPESIPNLKERVQVLPLKSFLDFNYLERHISMREHDEGYLCRAVQSIVT